MEGLPLTNCIASVFSFQMVMGPCIRWRLSPATTKQACEVMNGKGLWNCKWVRPQNPERQCPLAKQRRQGMLVFSPKSSRGKGAWAWGALVGER